jgi:glycosyltransferase involved in cell wall biosynthesis
MVELALGFTEKGHDVSFLSYYHAAFFYAILESNGIRHTCINEARYVKRVVRMRKFIRKGGYDAVLSFLETPSIIAEVAGFPTRDWRLVVGERSANPDIVKKGKLRLYRWFHFFADYVVANSFANMDIVRSVNPLLPQRKCRVIYNMINLNEWKPAQEYTPRKEGKLKLVVAASHQYLKNLNGLVDALILLSPEARTKITVEWYGDRLSQPFVDGSLPAARKKITESGLEHVVSFFSATREIRSKMQDADVVGLFSLYEGFPNAVCEGMACAKPVICSMVSDVSTVLPYDNKLLFDPQDAQSICNTLVYVLGLSNDQLLAIGDQNRGIALEKFDREVIVGRYLELLQGQLS